VKRLLFSFSMALAAASLASAQTVAPIVGRSLAATCANCHGTDGRGDAFTLAGVAKDDIVRKMREFKAGTRPATVMNQLAKGYTDEQIETVAAWFAAQKPAK